MRELTAREGVTLGHQPRVVGQRDTIWGCLDRPGLENLRLTIEPTESRAESLVVTVPDRASLRLGYRLICDRATELSLDHAGAERTRRIGNIDP